jgi:hypothetical protein
MPWAHSSRGYSVLAWGTDCHDGAPTASICYPTAPSREHTNQPTLLPPNNAYLANHTMLHHTSPLAPTPTRSLLRGLAVGIAFTLMASMGWAQEAKIREMLPKQLPNLPAINSVTKTPMVHGGLGDAVDSG